MEVYENWVLRIFGPKEQEVTGGWRNCIMRNFINCTLHQIWLPIPAAGRSTTRMI